MLISKLFAMKCINFYCKEPNTIFLDCENDESIRKKLKSSSIPIHFYSTKKKNKKAFEKIKERLMLQAGNWEINSYVNYFPAVSY